MSLNHHVIQAFKPCFLIVHPICEYHWFFCFLVDDCGVLGSIKGYCCISSFAGVDMLSGLDYMSPPWLRGSIRSPTSSFKFRTRLGAVEQI